MAHQVLFQQPGRGNVVVIEEENYSPRSRINTVVFSRSQARVLLIEIPERQSPCERIGHFPCSIGRAVVDDYDFEAILIECLVCQAGERHLQERGSIIGAENDTEGERARAVAGVADVPG